MRERLIELIKKAYTPIKDGFGLYVRLEHQLPECVFEAIADHLLAEGIIVPPCKVGDTVYYLTSIDTEKELDILDIFCGTTQGIGFDGTNIWVSAKYTNGLYYHHKSVDFGKTVFLTKEEAEKSLYKLKGK